MPVGGSEGRLFKSELAFVVLAAAVVWAGNETSAAGPVSPWYGSSFLGVPVYYLLFAGFLLLIAPYVLAAGPVDLAWAMRHAGLWQWVAVSWGVIAFSLALGLLRGVPELFADWRNLAVVAVVTAVATKWLARQAWRRFATVDLAITFGVLSVPILVGYAAGAGATVGGVRTTVFDGTTLYLAGFAGIVGAWHMLVGSRWQGRLRMGLLRLSAIAGSAVVLLSLRRSFWVAFGIGMMCVFLMYLRSRRVEGIRLYVAALGGLALVVAAFVTMGTETILDRLGSFAPGATGRFAATNEDHVNDIVDAWHIVSQDPIIGLGIGQFYETRLISDWKEESFEVHNAVLHVWLKFGLVGAVAYLGFHIAWARKALRHPGGNAVPIGAFIVGELVATLVGTWPYGRFQLAAFHGLLLAIFLVEQLDHEEVEAAGALVNTPL